MTVGYKDEHHLIQEKIVPKSIQLLATELAKPRHRLLSDEAKKGKNFEESLAILAARLDIALDGSYSVTDIIELCDVLLKALRRHKPGPIQAHHLKDSRLKNVELTEKSDSLTLEEVGAKHEIDLTEAASGEGPYTICRSCITSFNCIQERTCKSGIPAQQLGNTMKILKRNMKK